jgi:hypothetical protein
MDVPEDIREKAKAVVRTLIDLDEAGWDFTAADAIAQALLSERLAQKERDAKIEPEPDVKLATNGYEDGYIEGFYDCLARYQDAIRQS